MCDVLNVVTIHDMNVSFDVFLYFRLVKRNVFLHNMHDDGAQRNKRQRRQNVPWAPIPHIKKTTGRTKQAQERPRENASPRDIFVMTHVVRTLKGRTTRAHLDDREQTESLLLVHRGSEAPSLRSEPLRSSRDRAQTNYISSHNPPNVFLPRVKFRKIRHAGVTRF